MSLASIKKRLLNRFSRMRNAADDESGVAAIEFAFVAPILAIMLVGVIEVTRAISMDRRFNMITAMVGDLVSREKDLGNDPDASLAGMMDAIDHVMKPYDTSTLQIAVIPVMASISDPDDTFIYAPPYKHNGATAPGKCSSYPMDQGMLTAGATAIVIESAYQFTPLLVSSTVTQDIFSGMNPSWEDKSIHSPRHSCIDFENNNCTPGCP